MIDLFSIHTSLKVIGDFFEQNHPHEHQTNANVGLCRCSFFLRNTRSGSKNTLSRRAVPRQLQQKSLAELIFGKISLVKY
jgi:hypothetical protein